jgi:hypothetical protein
MSAFFIPQHWPESAEEEEKLDAEIEKEFPFDDKIVTLFVGEPPPNASHVRVRMFRELAGWMAFEHIVTDVLAGALLLLTWSLIAHYQFRMLYMLGLAFASMQVINSVRFNQVRGSAQRMADLLRAVHESQKPTWKMLVCALERIVTTLYRTRTRGVIAVAILLVAVIILCRERSWMFALGSCAAISLTTYLLAGGNARQFRQKLVAVTYEASGRTINELHAAIDEMLARLNANVGNWYSLDSPRPESGGLLHLPRRRLVWLSAFDMEFGGLALALVAFVVYRYRDVSLFGFHPINDGMPNQPFVIVSGLLSLVILTIHHLSGYERGTHFRSVILRRFSLESDLLTRRVIGPILAACGSAIVVVPQALAAADEAGDGAIISRGLRRSWSEQLIDARIKAERNSPPGPWKMGVFAIPRGAFAHPRTVTFPEAEWRNGVAELLRVTDAAVIDVSDLSANVKFEVSTAMAALPRSRIVFICSKGEFDCFEEFMQQRGERASDLPHVLAYTPGYAGRTSLRWRLCRLVRGFK